MAGGIGEKTCQLQYAPTLHPNTSPHNTKKEPHNGPNKNCLSACFTSAAPHRLETKALIVKMRIPMLLVILRFIDFCKRSVPIPRAIIMADKIDTVEHRHEVSQWCAQKIFILGNKLLRYC